MMRKALAAALALAVAGCTAQLAKHDTTRDAINAETTGEFLNPFYEGRAGGAGASGGSGGLLQRGRALRGRRKRLLCLRRGGISSCSSSFQPTRRPLRWRVVLASQ